MKPANTCCFSCKESSSEDLSFNKEKLGSDTRFLSRNLDSVSITSFHNAVMVGQSHNMEERARGILTKCAVWTLREVHLKHIVRSGTERACSHEPLHFMWPLQVLVFGEALVWRRLFMSAIVVVIGCVHVCTRVCVRWGVWTTVCIQVTFP